MVTESLDTMLAREREAAMPVPSPPRLAPFGADYVDVAQVLRGGAVGPVPSLGFRSDGAALVYSGAVNLWFGPPESGKTWGGLAVAAQVLLSNGSVVWLDLDHNGAQATIERLMALGVEADSLARLDRFRLAMPDDIEAVLAVVRDSESEPVTLVVVDSLGELLPMFGANSNDADDYSRVNRQTLTKLAATGAAVIVIDHEAKGAESRGYGSTGTVAKKRAVDGSMLRFSTSKPFVKGHGGKATVTIVKDRHGGVRAASPSQDREPMAATFELEQTPGGLAATFWAPSLHTTPTVSDWETLAALVPPPSSVRDVKARMNWGSTRAVRAYKNYGESVGDEGRSPFPTLTSRGTEEHSLAFDPATFPERMGTEQEQEQRKDDE